MPHLAFDYSRGLEEKIEMSAFCEVLRAALVRTGLFPLGGIRVRGHGADCATVADGAPGRQFVDMGLRIAKGRSEAARKEAVETVYAAAESWLKARLGDTPVAVSLELREIDPEFREQRYNTIHADLAARETG